jgi:hypothetical protein
MENPIADGAVNEGKSEDPERLTVSDNRAARDNAVFIKTPSIFLRILLAIHYSRFTT